jgi:ParB-like chromosome segregation protein Spo0J
VKTHVGQIPIEMVEVSKIRTTQESGRIDPELVKRSAALLTEGWDTERVPPIKGYFYMEDFEMTDGHHRLVAALALGFKKVPAVNESAMRRGDKASYAAAVRKSRKLIDHPLSYKP